MQIIENKNFGGNELYISTVPQKNYKNNMFIKLLTGAIVGFINGFWGGGGGMICVPLLIHSLKVPEKKAHATTLLIMLPLCITSLIIYLVNGEMNYSDAIKITIGFIVGGIVGALILKKISNVWLGIIFSIIIMAGGIKMLL